MFERYTESAKRAIFFARATAHFNREKSIDSIHLLRGLMWEGSSGAVTLFALREHFPQYRNYPSLTSEILKTSKDFGLTDDTKRILAYAAMEAEFLDSYSIRPEHLLLGILREEGCEAAAVLVKTGLTVEGVRLKVMENYPPSLLQDLVKRGWSILSRLGFNYKWRNR